MKYLGKSDAGVIVEFDNEEYEEFKLAKDACKGLSIEDRYSHPLADRSNYDLKNFFLAMHKFVLAKFKINSLEQYVNSLKEEIGIEKKD